MKNKDLIDPDKPITQSNFAEIVGISQPAVNGHIKNGILKKGGSAKEWIQAYTAQLRIEASGHNQDDEMKSASIREKVANARLKETKIAQMEGQLVDIEEMYRLLIPMIQHIKTTLEASSNKITNQIYATTGIKIDKRMIDIEHRSALTLIADYASENEENEENEEISQFKQNLPP